VPLEQIEWSPGVLEEIRQNEQLYRVELDDVAAEELGLITGSAMLKDETRCIRCGMCAERCPVKVITMEAYYVVPSEPVKLVEISGIGAIPETPIPASR
jgi:ferredoxin